MLASGCLVRPSPLLLGQGGDELAAEGGDVGDDAAPDQVALAECGLVDPGRAGVLEVVFDAKRSRRAYPIDYAGGDRDEPAVADDADGLVPFVHVPYEAGDLGITPELVRGPATRNDDAIELRGVHFAGCGVGLRPERVLAIDRLGVWPDGDDLGPLLAQAHHRNPVLEVLETLGHENRDSLPFQPHTDSPRICITHSSSTLEARPPRDAPLPRRAPGRGPTRRR